MLFLVEKGMEVRSSASVEGFSCEYVGDSFGGRDRVLGTCNAVMPKPFVSASGESTRCLMGIELEGDPHRAHADGG
jgi:hypothetical protein